MNALSFFTGAMGFDQGIEEAGFDVLLASEIDRSARATIELNRPGRPVIPDVSVVSAADVRRAAGLRKRDEIDLMIGGPPCQSFSTVGKRQGLGDSRGNLLLTFVDLIVALQPRGAVIENVRGLLSAALLHRPIERRGRAHPSFLDEERSGGVLLEVLRRLRAGGYSLSFDLYNAANFGTPQLRERVVLFCFRAGEGGGKPPYLRPTHGEGLPSHATFREAVEGLDEAAAEFVPFPEKRLRFYRLLQAGQNWRHLPENLQREALGGAHASGGGKTGFLRRLDWDRPAPTLLTHPAMPATDLAHPQRDRPLSIQEYLRLQEFPDSWRLAGSLLDRYRQLGNALPVGLSRAIGRLAAERLGGLGGAGPGLAHGVARPAQNSRYSGMDDVSWENSMTDLFPAQFSSLSSP